MQQDALSLQDNNITSAVRASLSNMVAFCGVAFCALEIISIFLAPSSYPPSPKQLKHEFLQEFLLQHNMHQLDYQHKALRVNSL